MIRKLLTTTALATFVSMGAYAQESTTPAPAEQAAPAAPAAKAEGHLATSIIGETVYNGTGDDAENIGEVNDIVIGKDGNIEAVVVGVGGFLGIGEKDVAVKYNELEWAVKEGDRWLVTQMTKEQLETQTAFDRTAYNVTPTTASTTAPAAAPADTATASANTTATTEAQDSASVTEPQAFVDMATASNMFEIESSKVALDKATAPEIKTFAQHMIDDHTKAGEEMKKAADADGVKQPAALDAKHQAKLDRLSGLSGETFDSDFLAEQVAAHEEAVALFTNYAANGAPGAVKDFASKTLPTLEGHLEEVKKISGK
jgi:predicted outer membrane protein